MASSTATPGSNNGKEMKKNDADAGEMMIQQKRKEDDVNGGGE